ncbi:PDZ domain-containing protein [Undibacterium sp. Jales W-56]|uniref:M61 family metallopeptidase n=1 Tax=Undibacterium sp. Jales W-56 TaxID=2897325 RepID=UPI0021CE17F3|nr:PDZ domain-containing protein [Undibacterium sp. Jales W-56]MCU6435152.1 PDZ domain-containing protein [Undibacterium sp. Jales W-56]
MTAKSQAKAHQAATDCAVEYHIVPKDLAGHLYQVRLHIARPAPAGQVLTLPAWIPGSYMIREFARHIVQLHAHSAGKKVAVKKLDKHSWQAAPCDGALTLEYEVYAWDLSVRAAHLDQQHGFFNGTSVFLQVAGQEMAPHIVDIQRADDLACKTWRVATSLPELKAKRYGFGTYIAANYDELIDHPVEMGNFAMASFEAHGVPHDFVVTGNVPNLDLPRIVADVKKICETQIAFFEPKTRRAPMERYVFMTMAVGDGYGGLEHRASTALICNRADLPSKNQVEMSDGYRSFLGLCSHEYFHTWNVKRIKPAAFAHYDLRQENYTSLLWLFEGFTSYYDDLMLVRSGLIDEASYFKLISKTVNMVTRGSGRKKQSVAESSFDAWTKYYRQDENSPNAIVSYYTKGSLVGLGLDLSIRAATAGKKSLDDVMRTLWQKFGRDFYEKNLSGTQQGLAENAIEAIIEQATGIQAKRFLDRYVRGNEDLPLAKLYEDFGVVFNDAARSGKALKASLGVRTAKDGNDCKLANVHEGRAAHRAGLSAGDILIAVNGLRVTAADAADGLSNALSRYAVGETVQLHAFRRDELLVVQAKLQADDMPALSLDLLENSKAALLTLRPSYQKSVKKIIL